jgi:hypothetical protein
MEPITLYIAKQGRQYPTIKQFLSEMQMFNWATARQIRLWFHNDEKRDNGRIERLLKKLSDQKRIRRMFYFGMYAYSVNRLKKNKRTPEFIYHGIRVSDCFIRLWKADPNPKVYLYEHDFTQQKPEFGITYSTGKSLLLEFCTFDNVRTIKSKIRKYEEMLKPHQVVLFVCDYDRELLKRRVLAYQPNGSFFFVDFDTFKSVPIREQLISKIYFSGNGEVEALRDVQH